jgi:hypothetical protein
MAGAQPKVPEGNTFRIFLAKEEKDVPSSAAPSATATQWVAGGVGFFTTLITAVGASTGALDRAIRDYPTESKLLILLLIVSVALGVVLPAVHSGVKDGWIALGVAGVLAATGGFVLMIVEGKSGDQRPRTSSSLAIEGRWATVKGTVKANGLQTDEPVVVRVAGRRRDSPSADLVPLYVARLGPDPDGNIEAPIETELRRRRYDRVFVTATIASEVEEKHYKADRFKFCRKTTRNLGCTSLVVPRPPRTGR